MTIKEVEERSGMSRANIRFYETEGLLHPKRLDNGYRDYSQEDVLVLRKIKLLRSLGISLEEIGDAKNGKISLYQVLGKQIGILDRKQEETIRAENVCKMMHRDMVTFDSLQPEKYTQMQEEKEIPSEIYEETGDVEPYIGAWRRYFARMLDMSLISAAGITILSVFFHINIANFTAPVMLLWIIADAIVMMLLEPVILHFFGTTPGKWFLGLYLEEEDGRKPSFSSAGYWSRGAVVRGMGLCIPILEPILLIVSWLRSYRYEELPWQCLVYRQKPKKVRWVFRYICAAVLLAVISIWNYGYVRMPPNRGILTVAEFAENYNRLHKVYGIEDDLYMSDSGDFEQRQSSAPGEFVIGLDGQWEYGIFYDMDGDQIQGITVTETGKDLFGVQLYSDRMFLTMMSFAGAQKDMGIFYNRSKLAEELEKGIIDGRSRIRLGDMDFSYELEMNNMVKRGNMLFVEDDGQEAVCTITYTMRKAE